MYDPDGGYRPCDDARSSNESPVPVPFAGELQAFCFVCGTLLTYFTYQPWHAAAFCADCVAEQRPRCAEVLDLLGSRDWSGTVVVISGVSYLAPSMPHMHYVGLWELGLYMALNARGFGLEASAYLKNVP